MRGKSRRTRDYCVNEKLSEDDLQFLAEVMNIGAGNAAAAFSEILQSKVDIRIPEIYVIPFARPLSILGNSASQVLCAKMRMLGDMMGDLMFVVPEDAKVALTRSVEEAAPGSEIDGHDIDVSVLSEVGNILAGVYLTAIRDFCGLKMYHTVPVLVSEEPQLLLDESSVTHGSLHESMLVVENEFVIGENSTRAVLVMVPCIPSTELLQKAREQAMVELGLE